MSLNISVLYGSSFGHALPDCAPHRTFMGRVCMRLRYPAFHPKVYGPPFSPNFARLRYTCTSERVCLAFVQLHCLQRTRAVSPCALPTWRFGLSNGLSLLSCNRARPTARLVVTMIAQLRATGTRLLLSSHWSSAYIYMIFRDLHGVSIFLKIL